MGYKKLKLKIYFITASYYSPEIERGEKCTPVEIPCVHLHSFVQYRVQLHQKKIGGHNGTYVIMLR